MTAEFIHHVTLHFPIVLTIVWAIVGLWSLRDETATHRTLLRWGGWLTMIAATVVVVSGIVAAPGWFGQEGSEGLRHHRNLGLTSWCVMVAATLAYDRGVRRDLRALRMFAIGAWCVAAFSVVGTGHWGGSEEHPDSVPWLDAPESEASEDPAAEPE